MMGYNDHTRRLCGDKHLAHGQQRPRAPPASKCVARLPVWNH